jgi:sulfonate transport system substrate-binding protein
VTTNLSIVKEILEEVNSVENWSNENRDTVAEILSPVLGIDLDTMKTATQRKNFGVVPISDDLIDIQQKTSDKYYELKLIPQKINVRDAILTPEQYRELSPKV